jgi:hypothetical protein
MVYLVNIAAIELFVDLVDLTTGLFFRTELVFSNTALAEPLFFISKLSLFAKEGLSASFETVFESVDVEVDSETDFFKGVAEGGGGGGTR